MGRKQELSILNVLFCFMVIFIHVTSLPIITIPKEILTVKILYTLQRLCSVAVYGFLFLSGVKTFLKEEKTAKEYYLPKIKKIIIPYLAVTLIYYFYEIYRGYMTYSTKELFTFFINGNAECHLYFVVFIVQFYFLYPVWKRMVKGNAAIILIISAIVNILWVMYLPRLFPGFIYNDRIFVSYIFFFISGCFCGKYYEKFSSTVKRLLLPLFIGFAVFLAADTFLSYRAFFLGKGFYFLDLVHLLYYAIGGLFLCSLVFNISKKISCPEVFLSIDRVSYEIYLIHVLFVHIINDLILKTPLGSLEAYPIRLIFVYFMSIGFSLVFSKIKNTAR